MSRLNENVTKLHILSKKIQPRLLKEIDMSAIVSIMISNENLNKPGSCLKTFVDKLDHERMAELISELTDQHRPSRVEIIARQMDILPLSHVIINLASTGRLMESNVIFWKNTLNSELVKDIWQRQLSPATL